MKSKEEREPKLMVAVGAKGVGKTYTTNKVIRQYLNGNPSTGAVPRKVLILDVNGEYTDYKRLALNDVLKFTVHPKIEARRIAPYKADGNKMSMSEVSQALR
jgi:Cdc6-like AAA superfamily ATPase